MPDSVPGQRFRPLPLNLEQSVGLSVGEDAAARHGLRLRDALPGGF